MFNGVLVGPDPNILYYPFPDQIDLINRLEPKATNVLVETL